MRDIHPDEVVSIGVGKSLINATAEDYLAEHDKAIAEARKEGAKILLERIGNKIYNIEAEGKFDNAEGTFHDGLVRAFRDILEEQGAEVAAGAVTLDEVIDGVVDFTNATE